jgi:hypothetical protein
MEQLNHKKQMQWTGCLTVGGEQFSGVRCNIQVASRTTGHITAKFEWAFGGRYRRDELAGRAGVPTYNRRVTERYLSLKTRACPNRSTALTCSTR